MDIIIIKLHIICNLFSFFFHHNDYLDEITEFYWKLSMTKGIFVQFLKILLSEKTRRSATKYIMKDVIDPIT